MTAATVPAVQDRGPRRRFLARAVEWFDRLSSEVERIDLEMNADPEVAAAYWRALCAAQAMSS